MARYRGPKGKIARKFNDPIEGVSKVLQRKAYGPGQHGRMRKKKSEYAMQLLEKQKAKYTYGLLERQFANQFSKVVRQRGVTGELLLQRLEQRLDNTVYRLGIAPTRRAARQAVSHRHIVVNGQLVNIPSYQVKEGDLVGLSPKAKKTAIGVHAQNNTQGKKYAWLDWDAKQMVGRVLGTPAREDIPEKINEQRIVELYSK